jgi:hypothetical protein
MRERISISILLLALVAAGAYAQTPTGTLQGTVYDQSQAVVPGATIHINNVGTNEAKDLTTDASGHYVQPFLPPGTYTVSAEAKGFKTTRQENVKLDVAQNLSVDVTLQVGTTATEVVEVTAAPPSLDVNTSTVGTAITNKSVVDLPLNGRNPFSLATLTPAVISSNGGESTPHMGGSRNAVSEIQLDGASIIAPENNVGINVRTYTPPIDDVQEFSVQTNALAAEYGRFGGGVINLVTKSGTNQFHGTGFGFFRNSVLNANDFFANANGVARSSTYDDQWGGSVGGPVRKNKLFFFFDYQGEKAAQPASFTMSTPIDAWRTGDYSGAPFTVYDPKSGHACATDPVTCPDGWVRDQFPGNKIPLASQDPVAVKSMAYFPKPNTGGAGATSNNFFNPGTTAVTNLNLDARADYTINDKWKMFGRFSHGKNVNTPPNNFGDPALIAAEWSTWDGGGLQTTQQWNGTLDNTITISPTLIADFRYGFARQSVYRTPYSDGFDITKLDMPAQLAAAAQTKEFPRFEIYGNGGFNNTQLGNEGWSRFYEVPMVHDATANVTKILQRHNIKTGVEFRKLYMNFAQYAYPTGRWQFNNDWTQQFPQTAGNNQGSGIASFLLGLPNNGGQEIDPVPATASSYWAAYVQDDFKITSKLTLNVGLRWDADIPRTERYNQLTYFDTSLASPVAGKITPSPQGPCPACANMVGQIVFVGAPGSSFGRRQVATNWKDFGPRFGFAYNPAKGWVFRGGYGIAYAPSPFQAAGSSGGAGMDGFQANTGWSTSVDGNHTIADQLSTAFHAGGPNPINFPLGPKGGGATDLGYSIQASLFDATKPTYSEQWNFNVQHELPGNVTIEVGYLGNHGVHLPFGNQAINLSQLPSYDMALGQRLLQSVPNPFYGVPNTGAVGASPTTTENNLLGPWPQYQNVSSYRKPNGRSMYHGATFKLDKRFSHGLTLLVAYTFEKTMSDTDSAVNFLGQTSNIVPLDTYNLAREWAVDAQNVTSAFVSSFVYDLPFGKGKALANNAPRGVNLLVSGWQFNGIVSISSGQPIIPGGGNVTTGIGGGQRLSSTGTSAKLSNPTIAQWFNPNVWVEPAPFTFGNLPRTLPDVTAPGVSTADLSLFKNNYIGAEQRKNIQFRTEWFNAFNKPQFGTPNTSFPGSNVGQITSMSGNDPTRVIQMAVKFIF